MTQKDRMLQMVLNNEQLMKQYDYTFEQLKELDLQEAIRMHTKMFGLQL